MQVKFEQNRMVQTTQKFELFDRKKNRVFTILTSIDAILEDLSIAETVV